MLCSQGSSGAARWRRPGCSPSPCRSGSPYLCWSMGPPPSVVCLLPDVHVHVHAHRCPMCFWLLTFPMRCLDTTVMRGRWPPEPRCDGWSGMRRPDLNFARSVLHHCAVPRSLHRSSSGQGGESLLAGQRDGPSEAPWRGPYRNVGAGGSQRMARCGRGGQQPRHWHHQCRRLGSGDNPHGDPGVHCPLRNRR